MSNKESRLCDQERGDDDDGEVGAAAAEADQPADRPDAPGAAADTDEKLEADEAARVIEEELRDMPRGDDGFLAPSAGARRKIGRRPPVDDDARPASDED